MLNEALRLLRVFHDYKSIELAEKLEISPSYLSEIEKGKKAPSMEILRRYAKVFNTTSSSIMFFAENLEDIPQKRFSKENILKITLHFLKSIEENKDYIPFKSESSL